MPIILTHGNFVRMESMRKIYTFLDNIFWHFMCVFVQYVHVLFLDARAFALRVCIAIYTRMRFLLNNT